MSRIRLTQALRDEYTELFQSCQVRAGSLEYATRWARRIAEREPPYAAIAARSNVPWYLVGIIHYRESGLDFGRHLHNGDPLTDRTRRVPAGRPLKGEPPFSFHESAVDALHYSGMSRWRDWSLPGTLYRLEAYNGFGYRLYHPDVLSPYLWGRSYHYIRGGYARDGQWSDTYVNRQLGVAVLLRRMTELGLIAFDAVGSPTSPAEVSVWTRFDGVRYGPGRVSERVRELQQALNLFPEIQLLEDGRAGPLTSGAFWRVTGRYLPGDPREAMTWKP
jgi:lysozyme family protein